MSKEKIEKAREILNKFINNEMQRNKLERDCRCGGWKIGDIYKYLELNPAIETLLQYIQQLKQENSKQSKMIDEMVDCIWNYDICDYEITDYTYRKCEYIADYEEKPCKECIKQYFEKKVEESNVEDKR